jgi:transcriptional regulator with XRE-family HTH domain
MVGQLIQRRRLAKGLTQTELARRTGLSQNYVSKLESGRIDLPQRGTLDVLSGALDVSLIDLYRAAGVADPPPVEANTDDPRPLPALDDVIAYMNRDPEIVAKMDALKASLHDKPEVYDRLVRQLAELWRPSTRMMLATWEAALASAQDGETNERAT